MITADKVIQLHKEYFQAPEEHEGLRCAYCSHEFIAWYGCLGQNVKGKRNNCCKYCLDEMQEHFEKKPWTLIEDFQKGFKKVRDRKAWQHLDFKSQMKYITTIAEAGIAIYQPPEKV